MPRKSQDTAAVLGIDIGKNTFHLIGLSKRGAIVLRQKLSRSQLQARLANLPPCLIGMEACVGAHHLSRRLEIGATWYRPDAWGSMVNLECKLLLLTHAFEVLDVQRVAFITDVRNLHSQAAIAKLGATREGVLRSHMVSQGGRMRDSVVFSIVAGEWPRIRKMLQARIAPN